MRDSLGRLTDPTAFVMNRLNKVKKVGGGVMGLFGNKNVNILAKITKDEEVLKTLKRIENGTPKYSKD